MAFRILIVLVAVSMLALGLGWWMMPTTRHHEVESAAWNALQGFGGLMGGIAFILGGVLEGRKLSKAHRIVTAIAMFAAAGCLVAWFAKPEVTG